jgi:hypothetical protein
VAIAVIAVIVAMMVNSFITNEKWDWLRLPDHAAEAGDRGPVAGHHSRHRRRDDPSVSVWA